MVSKRQKLARQRFKEAHPDLIPQPVEPSPAAGKQKKDEKKKKKKKKDGKLRALKVKGKLGMKAVGGAKEKSDAGGGGGLSASSRRKHPLRVLGMRPGESCFICKSGDHIAKLCPEKAQWEKNKICLLCRRRGHSLKNCPEKIDKEDKRFCYNCGEHGHSLFKCPQPIQDGGTKFAACFICKEQGHLSKNCPKNTHGVYPKGGSCKECGEVTHLAKFCPNKGNTNLAQLDKYENTYHNSHRLLSVQRSGDDLGDDFMEEPVVSAKIDAPSISNSESTARNGKIEKNLHEEKMKKSGPKVVNFLS